MIDGVDTKDYEQLIDVWEQSVRATHQFLSETDIQAIKKKILEVYFDAVTLKCFKNIRGEIIGFSGVSEQKLEMLFVLQSVQGQGVGSALCQYAIEHQGINCVDVNEQNLAALKFYKKMGFKRVGRSSMDGEGRPYPILHLAIGRMTKTI